MNPNSADLYNAIIRTILILCVVLLLVAIDYFNHHK
jgi:hypothetical protein